LIPFDHVSASQIDTFTDCRRKWWYTSVLGIRPPPSPASALGTAVHAALETYMLHGTPPDRSPAGQIAAAGIPYARKTALVELDMATHPANRRRLGGVAVHGRIDVFDPTDTPPLVQDWKTTSAFKWSKTESELRFNSQAILYARFAFDYADHIGKPTDTVRFQHVNLLTKGPPTANLVAIDLDHAHVDAEYQRLDRLVANMAAVATATAPSQVAPTESACAKFGGCYFRERCAALGIFAAPLHMRHTPDSHMPSQEDSTMSNPAVAALAALQAKKRAATAASTPATPPPAAPPAAPMASTGAGSEITPPDAGAEDLSASPLAWTGDARLEFEERAAIREHEGKQPRALAERAAAQDVRRERAKSKPATSAPVEAPPSPPASLVSANSAPVAATSIPSAEPPPLPLPSTSGAAAEGSTSPRLAPLVLYIDCYPMKGVSQVTHLEDYIAPMQRKIAARAGMPIYSLIEYGKGHAHVAAMLLEDPPAGNLYVNSRLPASAAALEVLLPLAAGMVRGH